MTDAFLVLCELPHVDPNWNKHLIIEAVRTYYYVLMGYKEFLTKYNPYKTQEERLGPFLKNPNMGFARTLRFMMAVKETRALGRQRLMSQPESFFDEVLSIFFLDYNHEYALYSKEALSHLLVPEGVTATYFQAKVLPLLKRRVKDIKRAKKVRMDPLKEEIVATVYHPRNVARWLEEGGFEELERRF
jgi:hypothetical protein